jgi:hypothetical protein
VAPDAAVPRKRYVETMFRTTMTLDATQRVLTALVSALVGASIVAAVVSNTRGGVAGVLLVATALALSWAMSPREIVVDGSEIRVLRRAWRPLRVPLTSIASVTSIDRRGDRALRLFGVGGFFGSYGLFQGKQLGRFRLYATRSGDAVLVRRTGRALPIVLTPDDVTGTVRALGRLA